jgi:L-lactate dehydrogenase complex protein LldG
MSARDVILARVRAAVEGVPDVEIPRSYRGAAPASEGLVDLLAERVRHYKAAVHVVEETGVADLVAASLAERRARRLVVPEGFPEPWLPAQGFERIADEPRLSASDLDTADGILTTCAVAIAETGTIVLDAGAGQGRRALTLLPDFHLCVVRQDQIVANVPDAVARLDPARPLTWISGPSATSDIELNRVEGVHGPRTLEVVIVTPAAT